VEPKKCLVLGFFSPEGDESSSEDGEDDEDDENANRDGEDRGDERKEKLTFPNYIPVIIGRDGLQNRHDKVGDGGEDGEGKGETEEDKKKAKIELERALRNFKAGQSVRCRVVGTSAVDGAVFASLQKSVMTAPFLRPADVKPGDVVKAAVESIASWGYRLDLGQGVKGHCTNMHLSDVGGVISKMKGSGKIKEVRTGQVVTCRVLTVNPGKRKIYVTMKPSLVKDKRGTALTSYEDAISGSTHTGFVTKVGDYGVILTFYGNVHGLLPHRTLTQQGVEDVTKAFRLGQVLRCVIHSCDASQSPPRLILRLDIPGAQQEGKILEAGQAVSGIVHAINDPNVVLNLNDGYGLALLHKSHLGDNGVLGSQLLSSISKGDRVDGCIVFEIMKSGTPSLTRKPLLLHQR